MSRNRRSLTVAMVAIVAFAGIQGVAPSAQGTESAVDPIGSPPINSATPSMAAGVLVKTTTSTASRGLVAEAEAALPHGVESADVRKSATDGHTSVIETTEQVTGAEAEAVAAELRQRDDVVWAMPNYILTAQDEAPQTTNDPFFLGDQVRAVWDKRSKTTSRVRTIMGTSNPFPIGGYSSKAPYLWRATKGEGQVVAILDTGMTNHPDLPNWNGGSPTGRMLPGYDFVDRDDNATDDGDWIDSNQNCGDGRPGEGSSWHGTHVAGIVAAEANNNQGIVGVAPEVKILPVRVLGPCGGTTEDIVTAIRWAAGVPVNGLPLNPNPADVINMSFGTRSSLPCTGTAAALLVDAIAAARQAGAVVVAAAGNEARDIKLSPFIPASCPGVIAVGATSEYGDQTGYSNYGSPVDISAPGGEFYWDGRGIKSTVNLGGTTPAGAGYADYMGTSMAAPVVAASAALIKSLGTFSPDQTEGALKAAVQSFPAKGRAHAFQPCKTSICGKGVISLNKMPAPINPPRIIGHVALNEPLTADPGWWNAKPSSFRYVWLRDGLPIAGASRSSYTLTTTDVGRQISVRLAPLASVFAPIKATSERTIPVPAGPVVTLSGLPTRTTYAARGTRARVVVAGSAGGRVELRRGSTVIASGVTDAAGIAMISMSGTRWLIGDNAIRAAFLGDGALHPASSAPQVVKVAKAKATVKTKLRSSVRRKSNAKIRVQVKVANIAAPTGKLRVYDGKRRLRTVTLRSSDRGTRTFKLPKLKKGKHRIKVVYSGTAVISPKTSSTRSIRSR